jgi:hypothetical protein
MAVSRCALTGEAVTIKEAALDYHPHPPRWVHRDVAKLLAMLPEDRLREIARELIACSKMSPETTALEPSSRTAPGAGQFSLPSKLALASC